MLYFHLVKLFAVNDLFFTNIDAKLTHIKVKYLHIAALPALMDNQ